MARSVDTHIKHLQADARRGPAHRGTAFVEVYQNCNIFNDGAFRDFTDQEVREDRMLDLEHGKPLIFGKDRDKGIRLNGLDPEVVELGNGITEDDLLVHDEQAEDPTSPSCSRAWVARIPGAGRRLPRRRRARPTTS